LVEENKEREPQQIRHLYDIAALNQILFDSAQFKNVFNRVMKEDLKERTKLSLELPGALKRSLEELNGTDEHKENYQNYVKNYIYGISSNQLSFEEAVNRLITLVESIAELT